MAGIEVRQYPQTVYNMSGTTWLKKTPYEIWMDIANASDDQAYVLDCLLGFDVRQLALSNAIGECSK